CYHSCKKCSGPQDYKCLDCKPGWILHDNKCVDTDECGTELARCPTNTYCHNTDGSYECRGCDQACVGCMGSGPARCKKCARGVQTQRSQVCRCWCLQQMFFGVVICALATLAAKGDMVFTAIFIGGVAAMAGYWFTEKGDYTLDGLLKGH
ncbi:hypothetical protein CRUP_008953, partial [Coryphaenoides rupestris]